MITVICPTYNEANYIEKVLKFFINAMPEDKELLLIDGGSDDGTKEIVNEWSKKYSNIHLLNNPDKYVPFALNIGVIRSKGDPIIRLDAHTEYEEDYFTQIINTFEKSGAEIVGGPMRAIGKTEFQRAVAYCTSTSFGIGGSKIHKEDYEGESDHVYLGAWQKKIFNDIGLFDEKLKRNQDDEFHYRALSLGKKIYLNPEIKSYYYPRSSLKNLFKQYFQYGLFKPLVLKKVKSEAKFRHLIPPLFVLYLITLPIAIKFPLYLLPLIVYLIMSLFFSVNNRMNFTEKFFSWIAFFILHISYGSGFILGLGKRR